MAFEVPREGLAIEVAKTDGTVREVQPLPTTGGELPASEETEARDDGVLLLLLLV